MSNSISSVTALVQNYTQVQSQSAVQQAVQFTMLKKSQDIQAQSIVPLLAAVVQNSPNPVFSPGGVGSLLDVRV